MKRNDLELLNLYGFKANDNGYLYTKELVSPNNPDTRVVITISLWSDGSWCISEEVFYGKGYSGSCGYTYKSLKACINRLAKDCEFYGFKKIA